MEYEKIGGHLVPVWLAEYHDRIAFYYRSYPGPSYPDSGLSSCGLRELIFDRLGAITCLGARRPRRPPVRRSGVP